MEQTLYLSILARTPFWYGRGHRCGRRAGHILAKIPQQALIAFRHHPIEMQVLAPIQWPGNASNSAAS